MSLPDWLQGPRDRLVGAQRAGRLPAALLIHEDPGAGGSLLALQFARQLLCRDHRAMGLACGECPRCRRVQQGEHPDIHHIVPDPELKSGQISVDQIREAAALLAMTAYEGGGSLVVIRPADAMTRAAGNALLKTLEEPRAGAHLVLLTTQPSRLPATVRSRCLVLRAVAPSRTEALAWLARQRAAAPGDWEAALDVLGNAPLAALDHDPAALRALRDDCLQVLAQAAAGRLDIVRIADRWAKDELALRLPAIENCLTRCVLDGVEGEGGRRELRPGAHLPGRLPDINIATALRLLEGVRELHMQLYAPLNRPLALECHLWRWSAALAR
ncbi:MAG: DNA polymerase III subunit [Steroidobacteraceae bacterium]